MSEVIYKNGWISFRGQSVEKHTSQAEKLKQQAELIMALENWLRVARTTNDNLERLQTKTLNE